MVIDLIPRVMNNTGIPIMKGFENISLITNAQALGSMKDLLRVGSWTQEERTIHSQH